MKTKLTIAALALALGVGSVYADNEKINLSRRGNPVGSLKIKDIADIHYSNSGADGFKDIEFKMKNDLVKTFAISNLDKIEYVEGLPDNPYSFTVNPHHMCATLQIEGPGDQFYRVTGTPTSELKGYDESLWAQILIESDIEYLYSVADYYSYPLSHWAPQEIFEYELGKRDWFPDEEILMGQEIVICLYTCRLNGDEVEVTTEPFTKVFKCKDPVDVGTKFNIDVDMGSTSMTVKVDPIDDPDIYYNIDIFSAEEIAQYEPWYLVQNSLYNLEKMIYQYGVYSSWEEALYHQHGEKTKKNLKSGDFWVPFVYGVEYGVTTTAGQWEIVEVPLATVTDDCTFSVTQTQTAASEVRLDIVPSNPDTRYVAMLIESEKIQGDPEAYLPEYYVAGQVWYYNATNNINWKTSPFVHSGNATVETSDGVINGKYLNVDTEYTVLIFGVTNDGTRTTAVHQEKVMTYAETHEDPLTFDITFSNFQDGQYYKFMDITIVPSDPNMKYVFDDLPIDNPYASLEDGEEEMVNKYVQVQGKYLKLLEGEQTKTFSMSLGWNEGATWEPYAVFVFGYDGQQTGPLYYFLVNPADGTVTQVTGPGSEDDKAE